MEIKIDNETYRLLFQIVFSGILGLIIGLEREHRIKSKGKEIFAGIRTFPFITIFGTLASYINDTYIEGFLLLSFGGLVVLTIINFYLEYPKDPGATTEIATFLAFVLGILVYYQYYYVAAFLAIFITLLLALKPALEEFARKISYEDIIAIIKFALITVVIYPLLPDKHFGAFDAFNPKEIWKVVVIVSTLDFLGYLLIRWKGAKTIWITGLIGGIISSTAVSFDLSKKARKYPEISQSALFGIALAWLIMNIRVLILTAVINFELMLHLLFPLTIASILYIGVLIYQYTRERHPFSSETQKQINFKNPFELYNALQFGVIYALILFSIKALQFYFGDKGIYIASFLSGVIDVDAITLSLASLSQKGSLDLDIAVKGVLIAVVSNDIFKYFYVYIFGNDYLRKNMLPYLFIMIIIAGIYLLI
ncbi:MAG: MgtC/SapB family protein [Aquificae bacterium]|nr:MgtC/SapB family protein [Aquificota bacterium]